MKNPEESAEEETRKASTTTTSQWIEYELEKQKLREMDLSYGEFVERLKEIAERLGI